MLYWRVSYCIIINHICLELEEREQGFATAFEALRCLHFGTRHLGEAGPLMTGGQNEGKDLIPILSLPLFSYTVPYNFTCSTLVDQGLQQDHGIILLQKLPSLTKWSTSIQP